MAKQGDIFLLSFLCLNAISLLCLVIDEQIDHIATLACHCPFFPYCKGYLSYSTSKEWLTIITNFKLCPSPPLFIFSESLHSSIISLPGGAQVPVLISHS